MKEAADTINSNIVALAWVIGDREDGRFGELIEMLKRRKAQILEEATAAFIDEVAAACISRRKKRE